MVTFGKKSHRSDSHHNDGATVADHGRRDHTTHDRDRDGVDDRREVVHHDRAPDAHARDRFGGVNAGASFLGWLVAVAIAILLTGIIGAIAAAVGEANNITQTQAEREAGSIGLAAAITLAVVLFLAYYTGGYVAGRMSRFDGAKQGVAVWIIGLVLTALAVLAGWLFGSEYNVFDRVQLPSVPISGETATTGGIITALAVLLLTLLAAVLGGKVGQRYHRKVDHALEW